MASGRSAPGGRREGGKPVGAPELEMQLPLTSDVSRGQGLGQR